MHAEMSESFSPKIEDRDLPEEVIDMRHAAQEARRDAHAAVAENIGRRCRVYHDVLDWLDASLRVPLETSALDMQSNTRMAALWPLGGRSVALGRALVTLVELGYSAETFPTARAIFEVNRMIQVFANPAGEGLARRWLAGKTPKPSTVASALHRISTDEDGDVAAHRRQTAELYRMLSEGGHTSRGSMDLSISHSLRELTMGPTDDWGIRAYYVGWAGAIIWEIASSVGLILGLAFGSRFYEEHVDPRLKSLAAVDAEFPFPQEHLRNTPLEFESRET